MLANRNFQHLQSSAYTVRSSRYIHHEFQVKFTKYIMGIIAFTTVLFLLPAFYFSNQNYEIFRELAETTQSGIASYLFREQILFNVILFTAFICNIAFWYIFTLRLTAKIVGPIKILRNHIRMLSRGDYSQPLITLRDEDEFKEVIGSYNYFYTLLKAQTESELKELNELKKYITNPAALDIIRHLASDREKRLGQQNILDEAMNHQQWMATSNEFTNRKNVS